MGQLFLAPKNSTSGLIWAWFIFAFGYLARPIGSIFWGWLGDKAGHGYSLKASLLTMAIPTLLIGALPTYYQIGFLATATLLLCRLIQGFAAGGELPVSACYIFETASPQTRGFFCSTVATGSGIGFLLGSLVVNLLYWNFEINQILAGAWRLPYLLSVPLTLWIVHIRSKIPQKQSITTSLAQAPFKLRDHLAHFRKYLSAGLISLILLIGFAETCAYLFLVWLPSYLTHFLKVSPQIAQSYNILLLTIKVPFYLLAGYISSKVGYKKLLLYHTILLILLIYPAFQGLQRTTSLYLVSIHLGLAWLMSGIVPIMMEALGHAYPATIRCSGMSITNALGVSLFGSTAPFVCTYMINRTKFLLFPAFYMIFFGLLALPIILRLKPIKVSH